jgi:uncharacterized protein YraI
VAAKSIRFALLSFLTVVLIGCAGREPMEEPTPPETVTAVKVEKIQPVQKTVADKQSATVTASHLNLRRQASAKSEILGVLQKGDRLEVASAKGNWLEVINPDGLKGWVYGRYVQVSDEAKGQSLVTTDQDTKPLNSPAKGEIVEEALASTQSKPAEAPPTKSTQKPSQALRKQLEAVWSAHRKAYGDGDTALFKKTSSAHTYGTMVNSLAASGKDLTSEDLTFLYELMPDVATLKFIELIQNGPTAGLLYVEEGEKSSDPNLPPPERFLFIKFVKEAWGWTVDATQSTGMPKYQKDGSESQFDMAALPEELAIDGKVRPAPKRVQKPKMPVVMGVVDISSYDYNTEISINGIKQEGTAGTNSSGTINGVLKKGPNRIEVVITKLENAESDWAPEVTIRYLTDSGEEKEGFKFEPEEDIEGRHEFTFMVE